MEEMPAATHAHQPQMDRALNQERNYDWPGAAKTYEAVLELIPETEPLRKGEIIEREAHAVSKHAFQCDTNEEFRERLEKAMGLFGQAADAYEGASEEIAGPRAVRARAIGKSLEFWRETDLASRKRLAIAAWSLGRDALAAFSRLKEPRDLAVTYNRLRVIAALVIAYEESPDVRISILDDLVKYGREIAGSLKEDSDREELARALAGLGASMVALKVRTPKGARDHAALLSEAKSCFERSWSLDDQAAAEEDVLSVLLGGVIDAVEERAGKMDKQCRASTRTGDRLLMALANSELCGTLDWAAVSSEVPEEFKERLDAAYGCLAVVRQHLECLRFIAPDFNWIAWPSSPVDAMYHWRLAFRETDPKKKRELAEKALAEAREVFAFAERSGYPGAMDYGAFALGLALLQAADADDSETRRKLMLEEAVDNLRMSADCTARFCPGHTWNLGIILGRCAMAERRLAMLSEDRDSRIALLQASAGHIAESIPLMADFFIDVHGCVPADPTYHNGLAFHLREYGVTLRMKADVRGDTGDLKSAVEAFERAGEESVMADYESRAAECFWEAAKTLDLLEDHSKASEAFAKAAAHFAEAGKRIKSLGDYYSDYANYMRAWSEVEKARHHHSRQEPAKAREDYRNASDLHRASRKWDYLADNYMALAEVEHAEHLSQKEDLAGSKQGFTEACRLFEASKKALSSRRGKLDTPGENDAVSMLIEATDLRAEFCLARYELEEARLLDRQGNESEAVEKYSRVAEKLRSIQGKSASEQDKKEIGLILILVSAWKEMSLAEAEASPDRYERAARLFEEAKNSSPGDKAKNLALGHARFCKALEAGARFADGGDPAFHGAAMSSLESAAKYYVRAGFDKAAEYARASRLLFDAYHHMGAAGKETDNDKKARAYAQAEKLLENSAVSYEKAGHSGKKEQVLRLLERAREDRSLAVSLMRVLSAPEEIGTTAAFSSPTPTHETAVGLEKFEHAAVEASLVARPRELFVGQEMSVAIELVNAGRGAAQLTKVEEAIPIGFDVVAEPERYHVEHNCVHMRGKRLDALRTEEVTFVLKPTATGEFDLRPRIMYLDESGKYKSCEPDPVKISVKELGVTGWLKGPGKKNRSA